ncbi:MAG: VWA domain-containing protein [Chloroflexi bacterium]|nr:VWA domain-containing protein [Chloroflexota bacterium]
MGSITSLSFITPLALALSALAIPIILLYMLRLRRTEMSISSTFLWQQLVRDREANAPWQKLKFNWLLLLQLLILAALVLALARPFTNVKTITTGHIILMLDASASMQATDVDSSRFAEARDIALDMVDKLGSGDTMTVIQVSAVPEVLASASRDKLVLRDAIRDAAPDNVHPDWIAAIKLANASTEGMEERTVVIISDGGLPLDLPRISGEVRYVPVGTDSSNLAISALATGDVSGQVPQLFVRISNYGTVDTDVILDGRINDNDTFDWARRFTVPAGEYVDVFDIELPPDFETLTTQLTLPVSADMPDHLATDNRAFTVRDRSGSGRVLLVSDDNVFLQSVFEAMSAVTLVTTTPDEYQLDPDDEIDLYVFDSWLPDELPNNNLLLVNPPRSTDFFDVGGIVTIEGGFPDSLTVPPSSQDDPRVRNLGPFLEEVLIFRELDELENTPWAVPLVQINETYPLVVAGERGNRQIAILPFAVTDTNTSMVRQGAWPVLMLGLMDWFSPAPFMAASDSLAPGSPVTVRFINDADEAVITLPDERTVTLEPEAAELGAVAVFGNTREPGLYRVDLRRDGDTIKTGHFAVNLFDARESAIAPQDSLTIDEKELLPAESEETTRREWWRWLLVTGLIILFIEWWFYHRSLQRLPRVTLAGLRQGAQAERGRLRALLKRGNRRMGTR